MYCFYRSRCSYFSIAWFQLTRCWWLVIVSNANDRLSSRSSVHHECFGIVCTAISACYVEGKHIHLRYLRCDISGRLIAHVSSQVLAPSPSAVDTPNVSAMWREPLPLARVHQHVQWR